MASRRLERIKKLKEHDSRAGSNGAIAVGPQLEMAPVGAWIFQEPQIIRDFADWRAVNRTKFFAQVPNTISSMTSYLRQYAIGDPRRVLFTIFWEGDHVGHIGLANISGATAELDNVMRGRPTYPGMMEDVLRFLKRWSFENLDVSKIYLRVKKTNLPAVALYASAGFEPIRENSALFLEQINSVMLQNSGGLVMVADLTKEYGKPGRSK